MDKKPVWALHPDLTEGKLAQFAETRLDLWVKHGISWATREDFDRLYSEDMPKDFTPLEWITELSAMKGATLAHPVMRDSAAKEIAANFAPPELVHAIAAAAKKLNISAETVDEFWEKTVFPEIKNLDPRLTDAEKNYIMLMRNFVSYGLDKGYYAHLLADAPPNSRWRRFNEALHAPKDTQSRMH